MRTEKSWLSKFLNGAAAPVAGLAFLATLATPALAQIPSSMTADEPAEAAPAAAESVPAAAISGGPRKDRGWYIGVGGGISSLDDSQNTATDASAPGDATPFIDLLQLGVISIPPTSPLDILGGPLAGLTCTILPLDPLLCSFAGTTNPGLNSFSASYKDGTAISLNFGYAFDNGFRPELSVALRDNDFESATFAGGTTVTSEGSTESLSLMGSLWYDFFQDSRLRPYIGAGIGGSQVKFKNVSFGSGTTATIDGDDTTLAYQLGAGLGYTIFDGKGALSLDYRMMSADSPTIDVGNGSNNSIESEYENQAIMLSLRYFLDIGKSSKCPNTPEGVAVDSEGCPLDSDGDGVPDYLDKCPGTAPGAKVDANGCEVDSDGDGVPDSRDQCPGTPAGVSVDTNGCPLDSDGDGVPDYLDKCPNTPAGTLVDAEGCPAADQDGDGIPDYLDKCANTPKGIAVGKDGCPLDSDGDGIPDYLDECPNSPAGAKVLPNGCAPVGDCRRPRPGEEVDENGCAVEQKFILRGVKFEFDSDILTAEAKVILDGVAATLGNYAEINVELAGHTDNVGSDAYNLGLSERRSNSVKNYLTGKGVDATRMTPVGYGLTQPIESNDTEEGREENRRVELKVLE